MDTQEFAVERLDLAPRLTTDQVLHSMGGHAANRISRRLQRYLDETLPLVQAAARPKLAWILGESGAIMDRLPRSRRLARYLQSPERCALVVGTAGHEWSRLIEATDDPFLGYLYSCAATALARDSLESARRELSQRHPDLAIGDTLSPGTDGLPLSIQHSFASLGLFDSVDVAFDPENLFMTPIASVTAVVGFGTTVEREVPIPECGAVRPRCSECPYRNCSLRVLPYQPEVAPLGVSW